MSLRRRLARFILLAVSFYGSFVLARSERRITAEPMIEHFGLAYAYLRELGGGWQLLQTTRSASFLVDFQAGARGWTQVKGDALLAVDVTDICATVLAAAPGAEDVVLHMPDPTSECRFFEHVHPISLLSVDAAIEALSRWAAAAGLTSEPAYLRWALRPRDDEDNDYISAYDLSYELVLALGIPAITPSLAPRIDPRAQPFSMITSRLGGLAMSAWVERRHAAPEPEPGWIAAAVALEERIWRTAFAEDDVDVTEILAAIEAVVDDYAGAQLASDPPAKHVMIDGCPVVSARYLVQSLYKGLSDGSLLSPGSTENEAQRHPIYRPSPPS